MTHIRGTALETRSIGVTDRRDGRLGGNQLIEVGGQTRCSSVAEVAIDGNTLHNRCQLGNLSARGGHLSTTPMCSSGSLTRRNQGTAWVRRQAHARF